MNRIDESRIYKGLIVHVFKGCADPSDMNWDEEIVIKVYTEGKECSVILQPLWNLKDADDKKSYKEKFTNGDYFQHTFNSHPKRCGLGSVLHDFLNDYMRDFGIKNVYSTCSLEDGYGISEDAQAFWEKREAAGRAINTDLNRFKIVSKEGKLEKG